MQIRKQAALAVFGVAATLVPFTSIVRSDPVASVIATRPVVDAAPSSTTGADGGTPTVAAAATTFTESFSGTPTAPLPWMPGNWDVQVHSRERFDELETVQAEHGSDCGAPPATHAVNTFANTVFICRDHMMTAIEAEAYAMILLTPDHMVDFATGEAVINFDMSTARSSMRDWPDVWITPFDDNVALPLELQFPDVSGPPRNAVHVTMGRNDGFRAAVYRNWAEETLPDKFPTVTLRNIPGFVQSATRRDRFELRISTTGIRFGVNAPGIGMVWFVEESFANLGWSRGVVTFGHHSYNPSKECVEGVATCAGGTWHWDNVSIAPAVPFSIIKANQREVVRESDTVTMFQPAPANAYLRFAGLGKNLQFSVDGGATWRPATAQPHSRATLEEHFDSYWVPIPAGVQQVSFRGDRWWGGDWRARDITVWSNNGVPSPPGQTGPGGEPPATPLPTTATYAPLNPARLLDTRAGASTADEQFAGIGFQGPGAVVELQVAGRGGVPAGAPAVTLNVTSTGSSANGFLTVWPCGQPRPLASNLNFTAGRDVANAVLSSLGADGKVCIYTGAGATHLVADVNGFYPPTSAYRPLNPARLLDTRAGASTADGAGAGAGVTAPGAVTEVQVTGRGGVPANAAAVVLNLTSAGGTDNGFVTAWPCGEARPLASSLNYSAGRDVANAVISRLGTGGKVCLYTGAAPTHLLADVNGYFGAGASFVPLTPARLLDTRAGATTVDGASAGGGIAAAGSVLQLQVAGRAGVPADANAVVLNVTSTGATGNGYLTVWPCGQPRPLASNLNYAPGRDAANAVISSLGAGGRVCIFAGAGATHLVVDVNGQFPTDGTTAGVAAAVGQSRVAATARTEAFYCELS